MRDKNRLLLKEVVGLILWWTILCVGGCVCAERMTSEMFERVREITLESIA